MQTEDAEEIYETLSSFPSSQTSSLEGIWATIPSGLQLSKENKDESHSLTFSLGKVGRILGDEDSVSQDRTERALSNVPVVPVPHVTVTVTEPVDELELLGAAVHVGPKLQEPDVVASTKGANESLINFSQQSLPPPVAPPRRKRKIKTMVIPSTLESVNFYV